MHENETEIHVRETIELKGKKFVKKKKETVIKFTAHYLSSYRDITMLGHTHREWRGCTGGREERKKQT